jgi:hypothetical protein
MGTGDFMKKERAHSVKSQYGCLICPSHEQYPSRHGAYEKSTVAEQLVLVVERRE